MIKPVQFQIKPDANKDSLNIYKVPEDCRSIIDGIVLDKNNNPISDALLKLYIMDKDTNTLGAVSYTFTDNYGEFAFGPVENDKNYMIKVWYENNEDNPIKVNVEPINDLSAFINEVNLETAEFYHIESEP